MGNRQVLQQADRDFIDQRFREMQASIEAEICLRLDRHSKFIERKIDEIIKGGASTQQNPKADDAAKTGPGGKRYTTFDGRKGTTDRPESIKPTNTPELEWKLAMRRMIDKMVKEFPDRYQTFNTVLVKVYLRMRDVYGIVLEQYVKEYRAIFGNDQKVSKLDIISHDETLRSLFEPILTDMYENTKAAAEKVKEIDLALLNKSKQEIIQPLIDLRKDKTNYGCTTYTITMARMRKNGVDFPAAAAAYTERKQLTRKVKNGELLENDPEIKRAFAQAVAELIKELVKAA